MSPHDGGAAQRGTASTHSPHSALPGDGEISLALPAEARSCALARRAVRAFCRTQRLPQLADDAALLTSELVGNAIDHGGEAIMLVAKCSDGHLTVRVADDNARISYAPHAIGEKQGDRVRRLFVVARIAGEWGATHQVNGKSVWFRLP